MQKSCDDMTRDELRSMLSARNLATGGTKDELLQRAKDTISLGLSEMSNVEQTNQPPTQIEDPQNKILSMLMLMQEKIGKLEDSLAATQLGLGPQSETSREFTHLSRPTSVISPRATKDIPVKDLLAWSIPTFSGLGFEDPEDFLATCEDVFKEAEISHTCWVAITTGHLRGDAQRWWQGHHYSRPTWEAFKSMLNVRFNDPSLLESLTAELHGAKQRKGVGVESFIQDKVLLHQRIYKGGPASAAIRTTIEQLDSHIRPFLRAPIPQTVEELTTRAI